MTIDHFCETSDSIWCFFFSSRRRHTRLQGDWSSDVCSSDLELAWLDANREEDVTIAQANARLNPDGTFVDDVVLCRQRSDYPLLSPDRIDYMDVAPEQLVSIAAALIPFLEHDDANRALMGSNMQRQAVPLLNPRTPLVGTGLEEKVARDSGAVV